MQKRHKRANIQLTGNNAPRKEFLFIISKVAQNAKFVGVKAPKIGMLKPRVFLYYRPHSRY